MLDVTFIVVQTPAFWVIVAAICYMIFADFHHNKS